MAERVSDGAARRIVLRVSAVDDYFSDLDASARAVFEQGTIRFTAAMPLPDEVVRDVVRLRIDEITGTAH